MCVIGAPIGPRARGLPIEIERVSTPQGAALAGDVNLKLGVRYCDYIEEELVEHHYDMRLSGGREDRGGKVALSYLSGEFVSGPKGSDSLPRSVFKLSYSRQWGVRGRLSLTVDRETAPHGMPTEEGNVTGQLRYQMGF